MSVSAPEPTGFDTRLGAYAVVLDDDDRVLLALWNEPAEPLWTLPGGGVDLDETPAEGAVREVREETGYDVVLERLLGVDTGVVAPERRFVATDRAMKMVRIIYAARVVGGALAREIGGSTDEARWISRDEVAGVPHTRMVDVALWWARPALGDLHP